MQETPLPPSSHLIWRQVRQQLTILGLVVGSICLVAYMLGVVAAGLLTQHEELRHADVALIVVPEVPSPALSDHVSDLYRRGFVREVILVGAGQSLLHAQLLTHGMPEAVVQDNASQLLASDEPLRVLVVAPAAEQLRILKQLRDNRLRVYHAPAPSQSTSFLDLILASWNYWRYVLIG
ncbi:MAG: hypothetical protein EI684_07465 [Candidatus Viridilinea halotolerans]|uniref:Uncharacterized protein n=1 Tax=Candidatus Viridilinea halotolerans TaxID=2491704 RepID=A0A426U365_9CHLR|nr:MAG: hypothetical protein EI684_07465 [Candidatus Viridilinea halotolerans]